MKSKILVTYESPAFPKVLRFADIQSYTFTATFVSLAVITPWVFHQFH